MANRILEAHDALEALVRATFEPGHQVFRDPEGQQPPMQVGADAVREAVVLNSDDNPETLGVVMPEQYELKLSPTVLFAFAASTDIRRDLAWSRVETFKAAVAADRTLGGVVDYVGLGSPSAAGLDEECWLGGGLEIPVEILLTAPSEAG